MGLRCICGVENPWKRERSYGPEIASSTPSATRLWCSFESAQEASYEVKISRHILVD
jgi:hypothetical protein